MMTFDEYSTWIAEFNKQLAEIAERIGKMALAGTANPENPLFVSLMDRQLKLINDSQKLTEQVMAGL